MTEETDKGLAELEALAGEPQPIKVGGKEIMIAPLTLRQIGGFAKHIRPIIATMGDTLDFERLLDDDSIEHAIEAARIAAKQPREFVESLPVDEFILLCRKIWDVNVPFFVRRVVPLLGETAQAMMPMIAGRGTTQSSVSPSTDFATAGPH